MQPGTCPMLCSIGQGMPSGDVQTTTSPRYEAVERPDRPPAPEERTNVSSAGRI